MKAIYHIPPSQYALAKSLGFTHVNIYWDATAGYANSELRLTQAREHGLKVILALDFLNDLAGALQFLNQADLFSTDLIYLPDEPNLCAIKPQDLLLLKYKILQINPCLQTLVVLSWIHPFAGYENCADVVGFDFYKRLYEASALALPFRIEAFRAKHCGKICGVPAVKYSPAHVRNQIWYWRLQGIRDLYWYPWTCSQEAAADLKKNGHTDWPLFDVDRLPEYQKELAYRAV